MKENLDVGSPLGIRWEKCLQPRNNHFSMTKQLIYLIHYFSANPSRVIGESVWLSAGFSVCYPRAELRRLVKSCVFFQLLILLGLWDSSICQESKWSLHQWLNNLDTHEKYRLYPFYIVYHSNDAETWKQDYNERN